MKSSQENKPTWTLNEKAENYFADNLFYIFVNLKDEFEHPFYHIVPSQVVANFTKTSHQHWLETPGRHGQQHNDNPVRKFDDYEGEYLERWDLLGL